MENRDKPAFQVSIGMSNNEIKDMGLTKREYFTAIAMQGLLSTGNNRCKEELAKKSVMYADEIIKYLENGNKTN